MKKKLTILLVVMLLLFPTIKIEAKTLGQLESELASKQAELNSNKNKQNQTASDIKKSQTEINNIYSQMDKIKSDIEAKTKESETLLEDIQKKKEQTKEIMRYYQVSSSGSAMLEYVMGAESLTDFIYRLSITEQITTYNTNMVKQMNDMIAKNEEIKKDLASKKEELVSTQKNLQDKIAKLNEDSKSLDEEGETIETYIKQMQSQIKYYKNLGCKSTDSLTSCVNKYSSLPSGTTFLRPVATGYISSNYGWRTLYGKPNNHFAVDIGDPTGTPIYSTAEGRVAKVIYSNKGGGNQIIVHHLINGKYYTSYYCHLSSINVSQNEVVTPYTVIGKVGSTGNSTGPHLHFGLASGRWYVDYYNYYGSSGFEGHSINPRNLVIFPAGSGRWSNR